MMDNMKDKFAQFSGISIMLVSASMTLFTRLVDGYYELKNVLSIIELTHSGECGLFFIKLSSSPDLYSIIVLSLLFEGMCCYE